jgi:hypothetical protein
MEQETTLKDNPILDADLFSNETERSMETNILLEGIYSKMKLLNIEIANPKEKEVNSTPGNESISIKPPQYDNTLKISRSKNYFKKSQNWIGYILDLYEDCFFAKLEDKNNPSTHETATFDNAEVSKEDLDLLKIGAIFYWSVGYDIQNGQVRKQSFIRFKRAVGITVDEFDEICDEKNELIKDINWD